MNTLVTSVGVSAWYDKPLVADANCASAALSGLPADADRHDLGRLVGVVRPA